MDHQPDEDDRAAYVEYDDLYFEQESMKIEWLELLSRFGT
jgi:hypothetical protein